MSRGARHNNYVCKNVAQALYYRNEHRKSSDYSGRVNQGLLNRGGGI